MLGREVALKVLNDTYAGDALRSERFEREARAIQVHFRQVIRQVKQGNGSVHGIRIYSARYSGEDATDQQNLEKLLHTLQDVPDDKRQAQFHCVLVYMRHADDPTPVVCHGSWPGVITREPAGNGGFGYDPIFFVPSEGKTAAELTREEKSAISHRGQALKLLLDALRNG